MNFDLCDLAPGEVPADRYEPADADDQTLTPVAAAALAEWEAHPWF